MDSNKGVIIRVADPEVRATIGAHVDLLASTAASFFLARNDITVGASRHACVKGHVQVPVGEEKIR